MAPPNFQRKAPPLPVEATVLDKSWTLLRRISETLASSTEFAQVTHNIVEIIAEELKVDDCTMYQLDTKTNQLVLIASHALSIPNGERIEYPSDQGLIGQSFQLQQTLNVANHLHHPKFMMSQKLDEQQFHSYLAVPLSWSGKNLGVLVVQSRAFELFSDEIVDMLRSLAPQIANLILNAEIFKQTLDTEVDESAIIQERITSLEGTNVCSGFAQGTAYRIKTSANFSNIVIEKTSDPAAEEALLQKALDNTKKEILHLEQSALNLLTEVDASIFATHLLMLDDNLLLKHITDNIQNENYTLVSSIKETYFFFEKKFLAINDPIFRERLSDLKDILYRLLEVSQRLQQTAPQENQPEQSLTQRDIILVAEELLPSELMRIPIDTIRGILCEYGGSTSHVAILAKSLGIPAMMATKGLMEAVKENDNLLLISGENIVYINPEEETIKKYADALSKQVLPGQLANSTQIPIAPLPAQLTDGYAIGLRANISLLNEMANLRESQSMGVGLYRSEFMFMMREIPPSEQDQYNIYVKLLGNVGHEPLTIRLLDIGADKPVPCLKLAEEENPALGIRGIRLLLKRDDILLPHLRAILRASYHGRIRILIPMVSTTDEIKAVRAKIEEVKETLRRQNINYGQQVEVGVMIETPSLLFELNRVLKEVDFISVGTNDLVQYLFAADRGTPELAYLTDPVNPTFFGVLKWISDLCKKSNIPISICGEMAGIPIVAPILVGLGYYELSMSPKHIVQIRNILNKISLRECLNAANLACQTKPEKVRNFMKELFAPRGIQL